MTIAKWGNSSGVRLSKNVLAASALSCGDSVIVQADETGIKIMKAKKHYDSLQELFDAYGFQGKYHSEEISTGNPVGHEVIDDV